MQSTLNPSSGLNEQLNIERNVKMATTHFLNIQDYGMR